MVISNTRAVLASIQAVSPESSFGGASSAKAGAAANRAMARALRPHFRRGRIIVAVSLVYFSAGAEVVTVTSAPLGNPKRLRLAEAAGFPHRSRERGRR